MMKYKTWFQNSQKLETTVNTPDAGITIVEGIRDVDETKIQKTTFYM